MLFSYRLPTSFSLLGASFLLAALSGCATGMGAAPNSSNESPTSHAEIESIIGTSPMDQLHWGILAVDLASGRILISEGASRKFIPASNMKVPVTAASIELLGPEFRYETQLWSEGTYDETTGALTGDMVVTASGDPTLSSRFYDSGTAALDSIAHALAATGLRTVRGDLVLDATWWDSTSVPGSWMIGNLGPGFGAGTGVFAVDDGTLLIEVTGSDVVGAPATVRWVPSGNLNVVQSEVESVDPELYDRLDLPDGLTTSYLAEQRLIRVDGIIPVGTVDSIRVSARDPVRQTFAAFEEALRRAGIQISGERRVNWTSPILFCGLDQATRCLPEDRLTLLTFQSPEMSEIVQAVLEPSQNWMAEQLLRTLGAQPRGLANVQDGAAVLGNYLTDVVGVDSLDFSIRDGSGLSAYNLVTPRMMVEIFRHINRTEFGALYRNALASPGEEDSTLETRLTDLEGRLFAKTGTISNVNSLSGYLLTDSGREVVFSILTNGSGLPSGQVRAAMDEVVRYLARN